MSRARDANTAQNRRDISNSTTAVDKDADSVRNAKADRDKLHNLLQSARTAIEQTGEAKQKVDTTAGSPPSPNVERAPGKVLASPSISGGEANSIASGKPYFRSVSVSVAVSMVLLAAAMVIYTATSVARNMNELSGEKKHGPFAEALFVASRSSIIAPMMTALCLACRMQVLAATNNLGEPAPIFKVMMVVACVGTVLQFGICLALPMAGSSSVWETLHLSRLAGEPTDIHPRLHFEKSGIAMVFQVIAIVCIYGGGLGVALGPLLFPAGAGASTTVRCIVFVGIIFFLVHLAWWVASHRSEKASSLGSFFDTVCGSQEDAQRMFTNASNASRHIPMLAALLLQSRLRWMQLIETHVGPEPSWLNYSHLAMVVCLALEIVVAGCIGKYGEEEHAYYGVPKFTASRSWHMLQTILQLGLCTCISAAFAGAVIHQDVLPLSHTCRCSLLLAGVFFACLMLRFVVAFFQHFCGSCLKVAEDTAAAAMISMNLGPQLVMLFVACRMRALQISDGQGSPQTWAMLAMTLCVMMFLLQALSCLALPVFTGAATRLDADGHASYDLRPMIGAYAVTLVKYTALMGLVIGSSTVCVSIFVITPATAHGDPNLLDNTRTFLWFLAGTLVIVLIALIISSARVIGLAVKFAIEELDTTLMDANITMKSCLVNVFRAYVNMTGMTVSNPGDARLWKSPHMLKLDNFTLQIDVWRLITTGLQEFEVRTVFAKGVNVCLEQPIGRSMNLLVLFKNLEKWDPGGPKPAKVILGDVSFEDVTASAYLVGRGGLQLDATVEINTVQMPKFSEVHFKDKLPCFEEIVKVLLETFLNIVRSNPDLIAKVAKAAGHVMVEAGGHAKEAVAGKIGCNAPPKKRPENQQS